MPEHLLTELVRRYSPSRQETPAVDYLVSWMGEHGFRAYKDEVGNACGVRGNPDAENLLILLGHIDTVPGEIPVRIEGGCLYGRGSVDAKGPLASFAAATSLAHIPENWRVMVVGAREEEVITSVGAHHICQNFSPNMVIIGEPSNSDRITLGYKGRMIVEFVLTRPVAHTARPEPTAAALACDFWQTVYAWVSQQNIGVDRAFDQVMVGLRSINTISDYFQETATLTLGFRLPPRITPQEAWDAIIPFAPTGAKLSHYGMELAYQGDRHNALVRGMMGAIRSTGVAPGFVLKTGTSDMNIVGAVWKCPMIAYGPGDSNLDHTPNEHIPLSEYMKAVETLRHFIEHLA